MKKLLAFLVVAAALVVAGSSYAVKELYDQWKPYKFGSTVDVRGKAVFDGGVVVHNSDLKVSVGKISTDGGLVVTFGGAAITGSSTFAAGVTGFGNGGVTMDGGLAVGDGMAQITRIQLCQIDNLALGAAGAGVQVVATGTCTGAVVGDVCDISPMVDDAAFDEGTLSCFVESANTVKVQFHADSTGADPADTNDYKATLIRF